MSNGKKNCLLIIVLGSMMLFISSSNEPNTYTWKQVLPFGNGTFQDEWRPGTFPMGLAPHVAFQGNLWMVGQKSSWSSVDGIAWTAHIKQGWGERISMESVYYHNELWMFGGMNYPEQRFLNEIWHSADGINWQQASAPGWQPRMGTTVVEFKNKLWLFGGTIEVTRDNIPMKFLNDIWSSEDGLHWTNEVAHAPWSPRDDAHVMVFNDALYMLGAQGQADVWRSTDGKTWSQLSAEAPWQKRYDYGALAFNDALWVFGGRDISENHNTAAKNDVWHSADGITWNRQSEHAPWTVRSGGTSVVFKKKLWIFSGKHTAGKYNWGGDVWTMSADN